MYVPTECGMHNSEFSTYTTNCMWLICTDVTKWLQVNVCNCHPYVTEHGNKVCKWICNSSCSLICELTITVITCTDFHVQLHHRYSIWHRYVFPLCSRVMSTTVFPRLCFDETFSYAEGSCSNENTDSTRGRIYKYKNKFFPDINKFFNNFLARMPTTQWNKRGANRWPTTATYPQLIVQCDSFIQWSHSLLKFCMD